MTYYACLSWTDKFCVPATACFMALSMSLNYTNKTHTRQHMKVETINFSTEGGRREMHKKLWLET